MSQGRHVMAIACLCCCLASFGPTTSASEPTPVINEIVAAASDRLLTRDLNGTAHLGTGYSWYSPEFQPHAPDWKRGKAPFGFGYEVATDLEEPMMLATPSLYLRTEFFLTAAEVASINDLFIDIAYEDGLLLRINNRELIRRNLGATGSMVYADQSAYNKRPLASERILVSDFPNPLREGKNILSIQLQNTWPSSGRPPSDFTLFLDLLMAQVSTFETPIVGPNTEWDYFIGHGEPSGGLIDGSLPTVTTNELKFSDWIEIHNPSETPINLLGWTLTDDKEEPQKWAFPEMTLAPDAYLIVRCSGLNRTNINTPLHTSFQLNRDGEYLALNDPESVTVSVFDQFYPAQDPFHSYGKATNSNHYVYYSFPTPGRRNSGPNYVAIASPPLFSVAAGFYQGPTTVELNSSTPDAVIRYTLDGREPTAQVGFDYLRPITLSTNTTLRARTFRRNWVPSSTATATYIINPTDALAAIPALSLSGDPGKTFYRDEGITAIEGGIFFNSRWFANSPSSYNMAKMQGRPFEKPLSFELLYPEAPDKNLQIDAGVRLSGSDHSRPRMRMENLEEGQWIFSAFSKPSMSFFFRTDYGGELQADLFEDYHVDNFEQLRLRAGKNDFSNPFIRDEVARRIYINAGQVTSRGILVNLLINGHHKSYFNLVERIREPFLQSTHKSSNGWDLRFVNEMKSGDAAQWNADFEFIMTNPLTHLTNYTEAINRFDVENLADYLLVNMYSAMWDWPGNNYFLARERTEGAKWQCYLWDAEGAFGLFTGRDVNYNTITSDLRPNLPYSNSAMETIPVIYDTFRQSPEFRLKFADRIQKHLFNDGALCSVNVLSNFTTLKAQLDPVIESLQGQVVFDSFMTNWAIQRPELLLNQLQEEGLWNNIPAPRLEQTDGEFPPDTEFTLASSIPPDSAVFYTLDGSDPRDIGGLTNGLTYNAAIALLQSTTIRMRLATPEGWSPLMETALKITNSPPALRITEIHYNPLGGSSEEFIELKNVGTSPLDLFGIEFVDGINFIFTNHTELAPGTFAVLVDNPTAFQTIHPDVPIAGVYSGQLRNSGENVRIELNGKKIYSVEYNDNDGWPLHADGDDYSLVPREGSIADPDSPLHWRASSFPGGSPGTNDPTHAVPAITVTEICPCPDQFWMIELHNPNPSAVDIGYWSISNNRTNLHQYQFPPNTVIEPGGYYVFAPTNAPPTTNSFTVSPDGGLINLTSGNSTTNSTGYSYSLAYPASTIGSSSGVHINSLGESIFAPLSSPTFGTENSLPLNGPVIISELMYRPPAGDYAFIELHNLSDNPVDFSTESNSSLTWKLQGLDFEFPTNWFMAPGELLVVTEVSPQTFRARYSLPETVRVLGPWAGAAQNSGERIILSRPIVFDSDGIPDVADVEIDRIRYNDKPPWPESADGRGDSLQRLNANGFGEDPINWYANLPSPGQTNSPATPTPPAIQLILERGSTFRSIGSGAQFSIYPTNLRLEDIIEVQFYLNDYLASVDRLAPFAWTWVTFSSGDYAVRAVATLRDGSTIESDVLTNQIAYTTMDSPLVIKDAIWKYHDDENPPAADWFQPGFDDREWKSGSAPLGYGGGETTTTQFGPDPTEKQITTYFRHEFVADLPLAFDELTLNLMADDGAVIYLNGRKAFTYNLPPTVENNTLAIEEINLASHPIPFAVNQATLLDGTNTLAIELHQASSDSIDSFFSIELSTYAELIAPLIVQQPNDSTVRANAAGGLLPVVTGAPLYFQWYREDHTAVTGANSATLTFDPALPSDTARYYFVVSNALGSATSQLAELSVVELDSDFDGLADQWETMFGFDPFLPSEQEEDSDNDGLNNLMEYQKGTHPFETDFELGYAVLEDGENEQEVRLIATIPANTTVDLLATDSLNSPNWTSLHLFSRENTTRTETLTLTIQDSGRFFRLIIVD